MLNDKKYGKNRKVIPGENALMVSGLGAMVGFDDLLPERVVLNLDLVGVDRLKALVQNL
jgi:hypothetical protein